ncbi:MAG: class I SAM-dependent methyltransferase [Nitrospirota bacterium]
MTTCPICGFAAILEFKDYPGYIEPLKYDILSCPGCGASFSTPLEARAEIYNLIYARADKMPGYKRYAGYADEIRLRPDPFAFLAAKEDSYWAVWKSLQVLGLGPGARVLEVGSGLGYLTYALARSGYMATGLDISAEAVGKATAAFGYHYVCGSLDGFGGACNQKFKLVIMNELLEHAEDPLALLSAAEAVLDDDGAILITTPNKSFFRTGEAVWETDNPPVHLWWFSEDAVRKLAKKINCSASFLSFLEYNRQKYLWVRWGDKRTPYSGHAILVDGKPREIKRQPFLDLIRALARPARSKIRGVTDMVTRRERHRRTTMCALISRNREAVQGKNFYQPEVAGGYKPLEVPYGEG